MELAYGECQFRYYQKRDEIQIAAFYTKQYFYIPEGTAAYRLSWWVMKNEDSWNFCGEWNGSSVAETVQAIGDTLQHC